LRSAVPVLGHVGWEVLDVAEGFARTLLPLNEASTNQHGSHQAALMVLAADYTGGIALGTLFRGCPIAGVHPRAAREGAALWLSQPFTPLFARRLILAGLDKDWRLCERIREPIFLDEAEVRWTAEGE
jgi:hypothetical protein